jgi:hypothetical protein
MNAEPTINGAGPESRTARVEREALERAAQAERDAGELESVAPSKRKAHAAARGWTSTRIDRALAVLKLEEHDASEPANDDEVDVEPARDRTKSDRALATMRRMPIHRGPAGLVLLVGDRVIPIPSADFLDAVRAEWSSLYSDETLSQSTISRALASIRADKSLPTTDRNPPPREPTGPDGDGRPTIPIDTDVERMANETIAALAEDGRTFQRSGELVHVTRASASVESKRSRAPHAEGAPLIRTLSLPTLREREATVIRWVKVNAEGEARSALPPDVVTSAVHSRGQWKDIPHLIAITESPFMRPDGTIVQTPGYDEKTGYLYEPNAEFPRIPDRPSHDEAHACLATLIDLYQDFPYVDDAARMVPISTQLTIQVRAAIEGPVPGHAIDAANKGTGKTLGASVPVEIATGRPPPLATFPTGRGGQEELEKMLGAYALAGVPVVFFDNVPVGVDFGGAPLEKVLTAPGKVSLRRLGVSETPELPWNALVLATGNNMAIAEETARRIVAARMVSPLERPEERTGFKYDLPKHIRAHRPVLVAAGLTIVRAYVAAGCPDTGTLTLGSFEAWSRLIPRAIVWAGGADIMGARVTVRGDTDEATAQLATILTTLTRLTREHPGGLSTNAILDALYPGPRPDEPPDGWEELRRALESATGARPGMRPDASRLGTYFRGVRDRTISLDDGGRKASLVIVGTHARANRWGVR